MTGEMRKYQTVCSNTLTKYVLFVLLLTVFANIITSLSLAKLDKSLLQNKPRSNTKSQNKIEKAASDSVKGGEINRRSDLLTDLRNTGYNRRNDMKNTGYSRRNDMKNTGYSRRNDVKSDLRNTGYSRRNDMKNTGYSRRNDVKSDLRNTGYSRRNDMKNTVYSRRNDVKSDLRNTGYSRRNDMKNTGYSRRNDVKSDLRNTGYSRRNDMKSDLRYTGYITLYPYKGGLGNQMFQLASLIGISSRNNLSGFLCDTDTDFLPSTVFDLPDDLQRSCDLGLDSFNNYKESSHGKYSDIHLDVNQNWTLDGYLQSYKYFHNCEKEVRNILQFKEEFSQNAERFLREKVPRGTVTVGIHVRRRDFVSMGQQQLGRMAPDIGYLSKAMKVFQRWYKDITFIVISDDKQWCKTNIEGNNVLFSPFRHPGSDLALASRCDHMIVTVGTFGWWGGWMSPGKVIYYSDYPRLGSQIDAEFSKEDYYPERWIPLHG